MDYIRTRVEVACQCPECRCCFVIKEEINDRNEAKSTNENKTWVKK